MAVATSVPVRAAIPQEQTWNAESVYANADAWRADYAEVEKLLETLTPFAGTLGSSPARLAAWLEQFSVIRRRVQKLYFYANMSTNVDATNTTPKELVGLAGSLDGKFDTLAAFQNPEILAIGADKLNSWLKSEAALKPYEHALQHVLRQQPHVRSAEVEELLGMTSEPFDGIYRIFGELTNTDMTFKDAVDGTGNTFQVTQGSIGTALQSGDRTLRKTAWENYADAYLQIKNSVAQTYIASVKQNVFVIRARHYASVLESRLQPFNLPGDVFYNLINTYKKNLPVWQRYWDVKRRALKQDTIAPYDIWAPLVPREAEVSYQQAVDWIGAGMQPLGADYVEIMRRGCLEERWVDYAVNQGKRQGAFSYGTYDTSPFIMMSFDNSLKAMSTLAHELGHSMHSYLSDDSQPEVYSHYSMFVAEVASNFNQALTRAYLFEEKKNDAQFQIALIEEAMSNFHRYFFIMPTLASFELEVHTRAEQGKPLTADILNGILRDLYAAGYGSTLTDDPERTGITWAQFGHLYSPFYTFQYATGISAAHALAADILAGKPNAAANYRKFLSLGGSMYPLDALKVAGVDMTTPEAVEKTFATLVDYVDRLEKLTS
jgi:oligoendopeptidase F